MRFKKVILATLVLLMVGCASRQATTIPQNGQKPTGIYAGDRVEVVTQDGRTLEFNVDRVDSTGLAGDTLFVYYSDMAALTRLTHDSSWKPVLIGFGLAALTVWALSYQADTEPFCLFCGGEWRKKD